LIFKNQPRHDVCLHDYHTLRACRNSGAVARGSAGSQAESGSPFSGGWQSGARSFVYQYRNALHQGRRVTWAVRLDSSKAGLTLEQARSEAKKVAGDVERGLDPLERTRNERRRAEEERKKAETAATTTLKAICEDWLTREGGMKRDADGNATFSGNLRSAKERLQTFERLVYPETIAGRPIDEVRRSELVKLLDKIEDKNGPRMAHVTLAYLSKVFNWHASRDDNFRSPIVRGMGRVKPRERSRERTLTDEEIRDVWNALDAARRADDIPDCYVRLMRALLFTAVRRGELANASWPEVEHLDRHDYRGDVLTIPASRMKGKRIMPCRLRRRAGADGKTPRERQGASLRLLDDGRRAAVLRLQQGKVGAG
jgi:hypothetical protein